MRNRSCTYYLIFGTFFLTLHFFTNVAAQSIEAKVEIRAENPSLAYISGRFSNSENSRNLSFVRSVAGFASLGERIGNLRFRDAHGRDIGHQTALPGEYVSDAPFASWSYVVDISPRKEPTAAAHVSWISEARGLLMFGDLLPLVGDARKVPGKIVVTLPRGWMQLGGRIDGTVTSDDIYSDVASVGTGLRYRTVRSGSTAISICFDGGWLFPPDEAVNFASDIYATMLETFRNPAAEEVYLNIFRFPQTVPHGQWQADTRGRTITIISSDMAFKTQSLQRLHEQLRHEIFHLWIPNAVYLSGKYDWFYEGFALYASLKAAVAMNQIRFEDFLDTLSRAYAIDSRQTNRLSLIDTSNARWNGNETYLYARGMFTAFLCDLAILSESKTKRSVNDLVRDIFSAHRFPTARTDGTAAILSIMRARSELRNTIDKYITGAGNFDVASELNLAGLELSNGLRVKERLSGRQKDLLDALGYNNWRRLGFRTIR